MQATHRELNNKQNTKVHKYSVSKRNVRKRRVAFIIIIIIIKIRVLSIYLSNIL